MSKISYVKLLLFFLCFFFCIKTNYKIKSLSIYRPVSYTHLDVYKRQLKCVRPLKAYAPGWSLLSLAVNQALPGKKDELHFLQNTERKTYIKIDGGLQKIYEKK